MPRSPSRRRPARQDAKGQACRLLRRSCPHPVPLALVLGSAFQGVLEHLHPLRTIPFTSLPGFPQPRVAGHAGVVVFARLGPVPALFLCGRSHLYEGLALDSITFPIRVLAGLGIRDLVLTNAAGAIHPRLNAGTLMLLKDHLNFMGDSPLAGPCPGGLERFVDLTDTYDRQLRRLMKRAARAAKLPLREGVYLAVRGPQYETPAEIKAFGRLGADAVGMSTVPEAIVAHQEGMRVAGISCITNAAAGRHWGPLNHQDVLAAGRMASGNAARLLKAFGEEYGRAEGY